MHKRVVFEIMEVGGLYIEESHVFLSCPSSTIVFLVFPFTAFMWTEIECCSCGYRWTLYEGEELEFICAFQGVGAKDWQPSASQLLSVFLLPSLSMMCMGFTEIGFEGCEYENDYKVRTLYWTTDPLVITPLSSQPNLQLSGTIRC